MTWFWSLLGCFVLFIIAIAWYGSLQITNIPFLAIPYTPEDFGWPFEAVSFRSHDGLKLTGWFIPAARPSAITVIVLHGIGSNAGDMLLNTACLKRNDQWNLFYFNFRGHADSEGSYTSLGPLELKDLGSALSFLKEKKPEQCLHIGIYGHSLGAAVAIEGTAEYPQIEAVAAESPFSYISKTVRRFARVYHGIPYFPFVPLALAFTSFRLKMRIGDFAPAEAIRRIAPRPILLIHAERDLRMPLKDFETLAQAAGEPKTIWVVPGADHGEPWMVAKEEYERRLVAFFEQAFRSSERRLS